MSAMASDKRGPRSPNIFPRWMPKISFLKSAKNNLCQVSSATYSWVTLSDAGRGEGEDS